MNKGEDVSNTAVNYTLYSQSVSELPDEEMEALASGCEFNRGVTSLGAPSYSYVWGDGLKITCNVLHQDKMAEHLNGFVGYVKQICAGAVESRVHQIVSNIRATRLVVGIVVEGGPDQRGRVEELIGCMCGGLTSLMFYGNSIYNHEGALLLGPRA